MNRFKSARMIEGLTQGELAKKLGVSCVSVSKWENGESLPNVKRLKDVAEVLHTTVGYLIGEQEAV